MPDVRMVGCLVFERLFLAAFAIMARILTVFADKGYDAEPHRRLCLALPVEPYIRKRGQLHGLGLGQHRWPVDGRVSWLLKNKRLGLRYDRRLGYPIVLASWMYVPGCSQARSRILKSRLSCECSSPGLGKPRQAHSERWLARMFVAKGGRSSKGKGSNWSATLLCCNPRCSYRASLIYARRPAAFPLADLSNIARNPWPPNIRLNVKLGFLSF